MLGVLYFWELDSQGYLNCCLLDLPIQWYLTFNAVLHNSGKNNRAVIPHRRGTPRLIKWNMEISIGLEIAMIDNFL
jgi:hypothetical protein